MVLHHIPRELVADRQPACGRGHSTTADRAAPEQQDGQAPDGHQDHTFPGTFWPHVAGPGVTQASIKLLLTSARWLRSRGKLGGSCPRGDEGQVCALGAPLHTATQEDTQHTWKPSFSDNARLQNKYLLSLLWGDLTPWGYVGVPTSPAGPCPSVCPITAVSRGLKPTLSRGTPKARSFASYVRSKSLWACRDTAVLLGLGSQGDSCSGHPAPFSTC